MPEEARAVVDEVEEAIVRRDYPVAMAHLDLRYRLAEMLPDLWPEGPELARESLVQQMQDMFIETSESRRERFENQTMVRKVLRRQGPHLWVESRTPMRPDAPKAGFAWHYRLTPRGTTWAITQREYLVDEMPSDSTRFWPMARKQIAGIFGRAVTLDELAANLSQVQGTMRMRQLKVKLPGSRKGVPTNR